MTYYKNILLICALLLCFPATSYAVTTVTLQWDESIESDIASYNIYYKTGSAGDGVLVTYNGTGATEGGSPINVLIGDLADQSNPEYTINGLIDDEFYYFVVTAVNDDALESDASNEVTTAASADPGYTVGAISDNTTEAGGQATFTVKLNSEPTADVTIGVSSSNTDEGTVSPASLTFTSDNWNANQTVTVTGVDDDDADGNQAYDIVLAAATSADSDYDGLNPDDVTVTNTDDETAGFTVGAISGDTTEAGGQATFTVKLNSQPTADVTIGLSVGGADPDEGTVSPASLTFTTENWNANQIVTVTGVDDGADDGDQVYDIVLAAATSGDGIYNGKDPDDVTVTNIDDDTAGITVGSISNNTTEALDQATFTVKLNSEPTADVTIPVSSSDISEGTVSLSSLIFTAANWNAIQTVTVTGVNDDVADGNQTFQIVLAAATSVDGLYNGKDPDDVTVINTDNDSAGITVGTISGNTTEAGIQATFTVKLNSEPTADVTIGVSSINEAEGTVSPASLIFTSANWNANQTVTVTGVNDDVADGDQDYRIALAPATSTDGTYNGMDPTDVIVTNTDDDSAGITVGSISGNTTEAGIQATFTIKLNSEPTDNVTIGVSSINEAEGTVSPASLTFTSANWNANQTVTVTGVTDAVADGDQTFRVALAPATSVDSNYNGMDPTDVWVTNTDDDSAGITVGTISGNTTEAGIQATFTVKLNSEPTNDVIIEITSLDTTEGTISPSSLTFTDLNWNANQTVTITPIDDAVADGDQEYRVELGAATSDDSNYDGMDPADVWVTNEDDDSPGFIVGPISGNTTEDPVDPGTATFTIKLNSEPTANVTIGISSIDDSEGTVSPVSLTFTSANWNANQTVTVTGVDDAVADGDQDYRIALAPATSDDSNYDGMDPTDVIVTNTDDDSAGIIVGTISGDTTEFGSGTATFTVKLNTEPLADVTIGVSSSNTDEGTVLPASLTFTNGDWDDETVTVTGVDDAVMDGPQTYMIVLAPATSTDDTYNGMDPSDVTVTNVDDDTPGFTIGLVSGHTTELGGTATFTLKLNSQPTADVEIVVSSSDETEGTVSPEELTFTNANWNVDQTVTVKGEDDDILDGPQAYTIILASAVSEDVNYDGLDPNDVTVTNDDNEEDETEPFIQSSSINYIDNTIDITFSESVLNADVKGNYTLDPELVIDYITDLGDNTYRLHMTTSIPSYKIIQVDAPDITDTAGNPLDTDYINDDEGDGMADDWEDDYGLDKTVDDSGGDLDEDTWSNYQEYMDNTYPDDAGSEPDYPEIVEVIPHDGAGIGADDTRVPNDTSFCIRIKDLGGIDCNDTSSITFTIDDDVDDDGNAPYDVTLDDSSIFKRKKLTDAPNTAENELWAVYHRFKDDAYGNEYTSGNTINIQVTVTDRAGVETQTSYTFKVADNEPDLGVEVVGDGESYEDPNEPAVTGTYDAGTQVNGGDLDGARILYASASDVTPRFGPLDEIPDLVFNDVTPVGDAPINLQPPTMFTIPAKIFIPCGYTDVSGLSIYLYKYNDDEDKKCMEWGLACDSEGIIDDWGKGWLVPKDPDNPDIAYRVNHNNTDSPTIEIKVYHFSGVQLGSGGGGDGSIGGGGCFIATAAFGSAFEKHVKVLKEFKAVYLLSNRLGLAFVDAYNRFSPPAARFIANHDSLRAVVRVALLPVVGVSWMALHAGPWVTLALMVLLLGLMGLVVKGRRQRSEI